MTQCTTNKRMWNELRSNPLIEETRIGQIIHNIVGQYFTGLLCKVSMILLYLIVTTEHNLDLQSFAIKKWLLYKRIDVCDDIS